MDAIDVVEAVFRKALDDLDAVVAKISPGLVSATDIHAAINQLAAFQLKFTSLPILVAKTKAEKAALDERLPKRLAAIKAGRHAVRELTVALDKLGRRLDFNVDAAKFEPETVAPVPTYTFGIKILTRHERIAELRTELAEVEQKLVESSQAGKKFETLYKSDSTRAGNLAKRLAEKEQALAEIRRRLPEMVKLARKTIRQLNDRQAHSDRKAAKHQSVPQIVVIEVPAVETPKGPTDDQVRDWAELMGFPIASDEDLAAARDLQLETAS